MLENPCKYSFKDLLLAANKSTNTSELYSYTQTKRNKVVKELCRISGWYWEDIKGKDGIVYTAFSPKILTNHQKTYQTSH